MNSGIEEVQQSWLSFNEPINKRVSYFKYKWDLLFTIHHLTDVTLGTIS
jgi:hypothetical protein